MTKRLYLLAFLAFLTINANAQFYLNEGSNRNYTTLEDEDGDHPDWIEIYNPTADTLSLLNYSISDNVANPLKWIFPSVSLLPGEYKTVFCSGKDRKPISGFMNVLTATGYTPTPGWNTHTFSTPFYWDGVSNILINTCSYKDDGYTVNSIFNQTATSFPSTVFAFQDNSDAACGFSVGNAVNQRPNLQINGQTIGTGVIQNSTTDYPAPYGNWYWGAKHQMLIRASELIAAGVTAGDISSLAFDVVSTDPAMVYTYIEFDLMMVPYDAVSSSFESVNINNYLHTNFSLSASGETVRLYNPTQTEISSLFVNCQNLDNSRGLLPDASSTPFLFDTPTPGATNNNSTPYSYYLVAPTFSEQSGIFATSVNVTINNPNGAGSSVYYTLDGSEPTTASTLYNGTPIPVFYSSVLKARAFANGFLPSSITVASFLLGIDHVTPIISLVTDDANLYGPDGIFDHWDQDWQKDAYIDYFSEDNQLIFSQNTGLQIDGGAGGSRSQPQHSMRVELANGTLGESAVNYPLIPNRSERTKYSDFYLRNGSNTFLDYPYKDAFQTEAMCAETNTYYSAWRPVTVYINGGYFGLYELREKFNPEYFDVLDNADSDSTDILSLSYWYGSVLRSVKGAPVDTFYTNYDAFDALNPASPTYWDDADRYFDLTYYSDYIISESWMANVDWPQNNIKIYRSDATDFRYRFCTIDLESGLPPLGWNDSYYDHISYLFNQSSANPFINVWLQSIQNNRFHDYFINRFADLMNTSYLPERLVNVENSFFDQTVVEMQNEYARWGDPGNIPQQMTDYYNRHLVMQDQFELRTDNVRDHIEYNFNLPNQVDLVLDVHPAGAGKIHISTIEPTDYPWNGVYFNGVPIKIEAIANNNYLFSNWGNNGLIANQLNAVFLDTLDVSSIQFDAYFVQDVTEVMEANEVSLFSLYPNPAKQTAYLLAKEGDHANQRYQLIDLTGRILETKSLNKNGNETAIDLHNYPSAVYVIRILNGDQVMEQLRLVKSN
jgi:hypothetical protein